MEEPKASCQIWLEARRPQALSLIAKELCYLIYHEFVGRFVEGNTTQTKVISLDTQRRKISLVDSWGNQSLIVCWHLALPEAASALRSLMRELVCSNACSFDISVSMKFSRSSGLALLTCADIYMHLNILVFPLATASRTIFWLYQFEVQVFFIKAGNPSIFLTQAGGSAACCRFRTLWQRFIFAMHQKCIYAAWGQSTCPC